MILRKRLQREQHVADSVDSDNFFFFKSYPRFVDFTALYYFVLRCTRYRTRTVICAVVFALIFGRKI